MKDEIKEKLLKEIELERECKYPIGSNDYIIRRDRLIQLRSKLQQHEETKKAVTEEYEKYLEDYKEEIRHEIKKAERQKYFQSHRGGFKMSELKTLKDFIKWDMPDGTSYIKEKELKAEAVKWVKDIEASGDYKMEKTYDWIINFFNLIEEDLK